MRGPRTIRAVLVGIPLLVLVGAKSALEVWAIWDSLPKFIAFVSEASVVVQTALSDWWAPALGFVIAGIALLALGWQIREYKEGEEPRRGWLAATVCAIAVGATLVLGQSFAVEVIPPAHISGLGGGTGLAKVGPDREVVVAVADRAKRGSDDDTLPQDVVASTGPSESSEPSGASSSVRTPSLPEKSCGCSTGTPPSAPVGGNTKEIAPPASGGGGAFPSGERAEPVEPVEPVEEPEEEEEEEGEGEVLEFGPA